MLAEVFKENAENVCLHVEEEKTEVMKLKLTDCLSISSSTGLYTSRTRDFKYLGGKSSKYIPGYVFSNVLFIF